MGPHRRRSTAHLLDPPHEARGDAPQQHSVVAEALRGAFPAEAPSSAGVAGTTDRVLAVGVFVASCAIVTLRAPVAFSKMWADDGSFVESAERGHLVRALVTEYRGYLGVIPRLVAAGAVQTPAERWAAELATAAVALTAATAAVTFLVAHWYIPQRALCAAVALSVPLAPALGIESINSIANQHFVLVYAAFWLFMAPLGTWRREIVASVAVLLIGLSAPLMFVLLPLPVARAVRFGRSGLPLLAATVSALLLQGGAYFVWGSGPRAGGTGTPADAAVDYGREVVEPTFGGFHLLASRASAASLAVVPALGSALLAWWWWRRVARDRRPRAEARALVRVELLMIVSLFLSGLFIVVAVQLSGSSYRYAILPTLFLCTFVAAAVSRIWAVTFGPAVGSAGARATKVLPLLAVLAVVTLVFMGWARAFSASPYRRSGPTWSASLATARAKCRSTGHPRSTVVVRIAPRTARGPSWSMDVECSELP